MGSCFILIFIRYLLSTGKPFFHSMCIKMNISVCFQCDVRGNWFTDELRRGMLPIMFRRVVRDKMYSSRLFSAHQCLKSNLGLISSQDTIIHFSDYVLICIYMLSLLSEFPMEFHSTLFNWYGLAVLNM